MRTTKFPHVLFELADADDETGIIYQFVFPKKNEWDWSRRVFRAHPKLKKDLKNAKSVQQRKKIIREYTIKFHKDKGKFLKTQIKLFQKEWDKINDKYMKILEQLLETKWKKKKILAVGSLNPINIRSLKGQYLSVFIGYNMKDMRITVAHELLHLLYFKKWKEVFPDANEKTFNDPHIIWHLSEILTPTLLNRPEVQRLIKCLEHGYKEYAFFKIDDTSLIKHFDHLYKESRKNKEPFALFLKKAYEEIKKYENDIRSI